jgi:small-conductance mechanosensitive channel
VRLRLLVRAKDQPTAFQLSRELLYQIKKEFERHGIEIPYPRRYVIISDRNQGRRSGRKSQRNTQAAK